MNHALRPFLLLFGLLCFTASLQASHFRYGSMSWRHLSGTSVEFKVQQAWRTGFFFGSTPALGTEVYVDDLRFGDGTVERIVLTVTAVNPVDGWFFGETTISHTYPSAEAYVPSFTGCCRIGGITNASGNWYVQNTVDLSPGMQGNDSPVTAINPIVNVPEGASTTFQLPATDPDGDPLRYRLPVAGEFQGINLTSLSVTPQGQITVDLSGRSAGALFAVPVIVEDLDGSGNVKSATMVDFFVRVVPPSTPPSFDYTVTPADNSVIFARPGEAVTFTVRASDIDPGSTVTLNAIGVPRGATFSPELPITAAIVESTFNWTPTGADQGTNVISITATDNINNQTSTAVSIVVSQRPMFDIPPTPATAVHQVVAPGDNLSFTVQASDADSTDRVQIISAQEKDSGTDFTSLGATLTPSLPTPAANPSSTVFDWMPDAADWGHQHVVFTAEDLAGERATHEVSVLVNTNPEFTSTPVTSATATLAYIYQITAMDTDLPYGDSLELIPVNIPSWLTLADNGDGTGSLSGVPAVGDVGTYTIELQVHDIHHHHNAGGIPTQTFQLVVGGGGGGECQISIASVNTTGASCAGEDDGTITVRAAGVLGSVTYFIDGPISDRNSTGRFGTVPAGTYTVTVDDDGDLNCIATMADVIVGLDPASPPVIVDIEVPTTVQAVGQILKAFVDYTDASDQDDHTATIDWGDGVSEAMLVKQLANRTDAQHRYFAPGSYQVTVTLRDGCGGEVTGRADRLIVVTGCGPASPAPEITDIEVPTTVQAINQILKAYVDYTDADDDDHHLAMIDWGDGVTEAMSVKQLTNRADAQHRYSAIGTYTVTVTLTDSCGNTDTEVARHRIEVQKCGAVNHRPIIDSIAVPTTTQAIGQILKAYTYYTDHDDQDDHTATIDWGDGVTEAMSVKQLTNRADAQHRYFAPGSYQVTVTVSDGCGGSRTVMADHTIEVGGAAASTTPSSRPALAPQQVDLSLAEAELALYPNPTVGEVRIDWTGFDGGEVRLLLTDLTGRLLTERRAAADAGSLLLDVAALHLSPGAYLVRLIGSESRLDRKLIVR
ncbi:PKD domain-containing protein [Neolewinella sp.]|uniref:PKD domain-containing protein n=1 Tax=Neolewinella sp. TaxID=2993543 RepID=UPI003B52DFA5